MAVKVRRIGTTSPIGAASQFNIHAIGEVIVMWADDASDEYVRDLEAEIDGEWKPLGQAFTDKDLITDNYNTRFFVPPTPEDRERGYAL